MACTIGEHGFCMYAKDISTRRLNINSNSKTNLTWEMLACANNVTARDKLFEQDLDASGISHGGSEILLERYEYLKFLASHAHAYHLHRISTF